MGNSAAERLTSPTMSVSQDIVEYLDPDWRDHFTNVEDAYEHYYRYAHRDFCAAYREVTGDEWHSDP